MFNKLTTWEYQRNFKEAFGFYLAYLFFGVILSALIGALFAGSSFQSGLVLGQKLAIVYTLGLSLWVLKAKNQLKNFPLVLVALLSGLIAVLGGMLLGLIATAHLTTKPKSSKNKKRK